MRSITLSLRGQLSIPRQLRESLDMLPGSRLHVNLDRNGPLRLELALHEAEELFFARPSAAYAAMIPEDTNQLINAATG